MWRWLRRRYGDRIDLQRRNTSGRLRRSLDGPHPLSALQVRMSVKSQGKAETAHQGRPWDLSQTPFGRTRHLEMSVTDGKANANSTAHALLAVSNLGSGGRLITSSGTSDFLCEHVYPCQKCAQEQRTCITSTFKLEWRTQPGA